MEWLNYHHLLYFWTVAREGSVSRAASKLRLAQPTVSGQVRALEEALGEKLFVRQGRSLALTEVGKVAFRYADEMFSIGQDLLNAVKGRPTGRPLKLNVGVAEVVPKLLAHKLLEPALRMDHLVNLVCREGKTRTLLTELANHELDVVLSDTPVPPTVKVQAHSHLLVDSSTVMFATRAIARRMRGRFPAALSGLPMLLPTRNTTLRRALDDWFAARRVIPSIVGEFEDSATMKAFGQAGHGVFPGAAVMSQEIVRQYRVQIVGRMEDVRQRFYGLTVERRLRHPAVIAISQSATQTFA
ncbi:transcriptional activator NhaR [Petrachloros mirabilis]